MKKSHKHVKKIWGAIKKKRKPEKKAKKRKNLRLSRLRVRGPWRRRTGANPCMGFGSVCTGNAVALISCALSTRSLDKIKFCYMRMKKRKER